MSWSAGSRRNHDARASGVPPHALAGARADRRSRLHHGTGVAPAARSPGGHGAAPMSVGFRAVQWNRRKIVYDAVLVAGVALFIGTFMTIGALRNPPADMPAWINLRIKAFGACAFTMLTLILMIGPLARLDRRFLPLLYNRRHFGVLTFLVALVHAYSVVDWFAVQGAMGD